MRLNLRIRLPRIQVFHPRPADATRSSGIRGQDRLIWAAVLGILVLTIGLIPLYLLASARRPAPTPISNPPPAIAPTPAPSRPEVTPTTVVQEVTSNPTPRAIQTPEAVPTSAPNDPRIAFLLLGYGGANHDGGYLTDSIMTVIVDSDHKTLTLLSLPRDSWVPMLFDGRTPTYNKVNTAYAFAKDPSLFPERLDKYSGEQGAGTFTMDTVSRLLGVPISYYLTLDFDGFRQAIDAVGGIDVNVPTGFVAQYPANDDPAIDPRWTTVRFRQGLQHLGGERAIEYARAREVLDNSGEGSDFARSRRQRLIIEAFKTRLLQPGGLVHLPQLIAIASQHVDTNYTIPAVTKLSQLLADWQNVQFYQTALTTDNYLEVATGSDGAYLLVPSSRDHTWRQIRGFVRRLWDEPAAGVAMASTIVIVRDDSGISGLGERVSTSLAALGYRVDMASAGPPLDQTRVIDRTGGKAGPLITQLQKDLGLTYLPVVDESAESSSLVSLRDDSSETPELVLELGTDGLNLNIPDSVDSEAPSSAVGVVKFGSWAPDFGSPTPTATVTPGPGTPVASSGSSGDRSGRAPAIATPITVPNSPDVVVVPNLIGLPEARAQRVINESGLMTTYVNYQTIDQVADRKFFQSISPGAVLSQHPVAGTKVPRGTRVELAVRKD